MYIGFVPTLSEEKKAQLISIIDSIPELYVDNNEYNRNVLTVRLTVDKPKMILQGDFDYYNYVPEPVPMTPKEEYDYARQERLKYLSNSYDAIVAFEKKLVSQ